MSVLPDPKSSFPTSPGGEALDEMACVWSSAFEAWADYLVRLATASSPLAAFEAGAVFLNKSLQIGDRATNTRLQVAGVADPLLTDA